MYRDDFVALADFDDRIDKIRSHIRASLGSGGLYKDVIDWGCARACAPGRPRPRPIRRRPPIHSRTHDGDAVPPYA